MQGYARFYVLFMVIVFNRKYVTVNGRFYDYHRLVLNLVMMLKYIHMINHKEEMGKFLILWLNFKVFNVIFNCRFHDIGCSMVNLVVI